MRCEIEELLRLIRAGESIIRGFAETGGVLAVRMLEEGKGLGKRGFSPEVCVAYQLEE